MLLFQSSVERLLSRDSFCASEIEIFRAVCSWLQNSKESNCRTSQTLHLSNTPVITADNNGNNDSNNMAEQTSLSTEKKEPNISCLAEDNTKTISSLSSPSHMEKSPSITGKPIALVNFVRYSD